MNHAAWVLGHLAFVFDSMIKVFGEQPAMPQGMGRAVQSRLEAGERSRHYPSKAALLEAYEKSYLRIVEAVKNASAETLEREFPNPRLRPTLPTIGVAMVHILTSHQAGHLGQLSAWRRMQGLSAI